MARLKTTKPTKHPTPTPPKAPPSLSWEEATSRYELHLRAGVVAPTTTYGYMLEIKRMHDHFKARGVKSPAAVELQHLRDYQVGLLTGAASRTGRPNSVGTVHRITTTLGQFFGFLTVEGFLLTDPSLRLERPRLPRAVPGEVLTLPEIQTLLAAPDCTTAIGLRDRALLEVLYGGGLRRLEAIQLDLTSLDHTTREVRVLGKGAKTRVVPLTRSAWAEIQTYVKSGRPGLSSDHPDSGKALFLSNLGRRVCEVTVMKTVNRYVAQVGIAKHVTPHTFRRSYATHLLLAGVSLRHIQILLGHEKLTTTALYLKLDTKELRRELLLKHPRERFDV